MAATFLSFLWEIMRPESAFGNNPKVTFASRQKGTVGKDAREEAGACYIESGTL
jgi:hypothetical protein